jgi:hypothetical protein
LLNEGPGTYNDIGKEEPEVSAAPENRPLVRRRVLPPAEWWRIADIYAEQGEELPSVEDAIIYILEDRDGTILSTFAVHRVLLIGLVYTSPVVRQAGLASMLSDYVNGEFQPGMSAFTVINNPHTEKIALERGMVEIPGKIFRKDF